MLFSPTGPEVPPDQAVPPVIDEPTQRLHIITAPPTRVEGRAVLVYEPTPRKPWRLWAFAAVLVALTVGVVLGQAQAYQPISRGSTAQAAVIPAPSTAPVPLGTAKAQTLELSGTATTVHVVSTDLGDRLYSVEASNPAVIDTPDGPRVQVGGADAVIRLNAKVAWTIRVTALSSDQDLDLRAGGLATLTLAGSTSRATLRLPKPSGTAKLTVTAAITDLQITAPVPVRLGLERGADITVVDGSTLRKIKPGTTVTAKDWKPAKNRYDLTDTAPVSSVTAG